MKHSNLKLYQLDNLKAQAMLTDLLEDFLLNLLLY